MYMSRSAGPGPPTDCFTAHTQPCACTQGLAKSSPLNFARKTGSHTGLRNPDQHRVHEYASVGTLAADSGLDAEGRSKHSRKNHSPALKPTTMQLIMQMQPPHAPHTALLPRRTHQSPTHILLRHPRPSSCPLSLSSSPTHTRTSTRTSIPTRTRTPTPTIR